MWHNVFGTSCAHEGFFLKYTGVRMMRNKKMIWIISIFIVFVLVIYIAFIKKDILKEETLGAGSSDNYKKNISIDKGSERKRDEYDSNSDLGLRIDEVLGDYKDNVAIYYYNLNTNEKYTLNENKEFIAASTTKVATAMDIADQVQSGVFSMDTLVDYTEEDYEEGSGVLYLQDEIEPLPISKIIELSITESDNIAKNMLRRISKIKTDDYIEKVTGEKVTPGNITTAQQQFEILYRLYTNPDGNEYYDDIIEHMKNTIYDDRIAKYVPYENVAHKIGEYYRYYHDIGIVYDENPYILVVLTKDIGELSDTSYEGDGEADDKYLVDWGESAIELIEEISRVVYENQ